MFVLVMVSLEMEKFIFDWFFFIIELFQKVQMDSFQLIYCWEFVVYYFFILQFFLFLNFVYVYCFFKYILVICDKGVFRLYFFFVLGLDFFKDNSKLEVLVRGVVVFYYYFLVVSGCKQIFVKCKVEEMEVDDFYDGIKWFYNEDNVLENVGFVCGIDLLR